MDAEQRAKAITTLLRRAGQAMGLNLCFHDRLRRVQEVPQPWRHHRAAYCRRNKARDLARCHNFDGNEVHRALSGLPEGRVHECPLGVTELAVPVMEGGLMVGVLFAGPCWRRPTPPPDPAMVVNPSRQWLAGQLTLLRGVARLLTELMRLAPDTVLGDRRLQITQHIEEHMAEPIRLANLARHISLSLPVAGATCDSGDLRPVILGTGPIREDPGGRPSSANDELAGRRDRDAHRLRRPELLHARVHPPPAHNAARLSPGTPPGGTLTAASD